MPSFVTRMFTPSNSDSQSGAEYNEMFNAMQPAPMPAAPTPEDANAKAKEAADKKRRMRLLAGGKTLLDEGGVDGGTGGAKTLLGS